MNQVTYVNHMSIHPRIFSTIRLAEVNPMVTAGAKVGGNISISWVYPLGTVISKTTIIADIHSVQNDKSAHTSIDIPITG